MSRDETPLKKILILGARGMLGTALMNEFADFTPTGWDSTELDITDFTLTEAKINQLKPSVIINAAAYTAVDNCEKEVDTCMLVNGEAVGNLGNIAHTIGATIIHFSTDYVFDGTQQEGYHEDDRAHLKPLNSYGASKARGEHVLREQTDNYYLIRTSWLYGENGKNFVATMLKLASERDTLNVVNDQHGRPTYTKDLAAQTRRMLEEKKPFGTYHITNSGECTWYEFAREIFKQSGISIKLNPCTSKEYPVPAKRPEYSLLNNTKIPALRPWNQALTAYLQHN